jgi:hypothetical protein
MPRNRVQHQKGLSDDGFEQRYPELGLLRLVDDDYEIWRHFHGA